MPILPALLSCWRRKATWFALVVGLLTAATCWWLVPYAPRRSVPVRNGVDAVFSRDFHYAAVASYELPVGEDEAEVKWILWDLADGRALFSFPLPKENRERSYYGLEFSPDNELVVEFDRGKANFRKMPHGDPWGSDAATVFPHDRINGPTSQLTMAADGRLLVIALDEFKRGSIRDLLSGKEVGTLPQWFDDPDNFFPGGCWQRIRDKIEIRELPSGQLRRELDFSDNTDLWANCSWALTPDANTAALVCCNQKIQVWDLRTGRRRRLDVPAEHMMLFQRVAVSTDGRYLTLVMDRPRAPNHPWLDWLMDRLGRLPKEGPELVVYDLTTNSEVAAFRNSPKPEPWSYPGIAKFSLDGRSLAIIQGKSLDIYDFPLHRPWGKIAAYALTATAVVWVLAWLIGRKAALRRRPIAITNFTEVA